ncbi:MAG: methylmalonyl-CoA epimerase [Chloroflexota bacterium]
MNHVAVVVDDLDEAKRFWVDTLGLTLAGEEHVASQAVDVAFLPVGDSKIELLQPTDAESGVARYLQKRGSGMHHICFEVDDIEAALAKLKTAEIQLINEQPVVGSDGRKFAFIHPKAANGVLVELYELAAE